MDTPRSPDASVSFTDSSLPPTMPPLSPRLPSPPPPTEIQIGPKSPSIGPEQNAIEANARRRIHPGTKAADMAAGPPLVSLNELDSAFQLQEHLSALHHHHTRPSSSPASTVPIDRQTAHLLASPPSPTIDRTLWLYELTRLIIQQCNSLLIGFLFDTPPCSALTCPEMRASEWQFLCAVHEQPKSCCAIDYCCHTLDWAGNIVTSQKIFPSRLSISGAGSGERGHEQGKSGMQGLGVKHLVNIFRRLHRIFAHAWFQHRGVFWDVENREGLYVLFKTVCDVYELLPAENYKLPPEAEGLEPSGEQELDTPAAPTGILKREDKAGSEEEDVFNVPGGVGRTNTRRHVRQNPSVGSVVTTVLESDEEENGGDVTAQLGALSLSAPELSPVELHAEKSGQRGESEAEVPVIVESYPPVETPAQMVTHDDVAVPSGGLEEMAISAPDSGEGEDTMASSGEEWDGSAVDTPEGSSPDDSVGKESVQEKGLGHAKSEAKGELGAVAKENNPGEDKPKLGEEEVKGEEISDL